MGFQINIPFSIYTVSALMVLFVAWRVWKSDPFPGRHMMFLTMLASAEWAFTAGMVNAVFLMESKILWAKIEYIGAVSTPVLLFLFNAQYTGFIKRQTRKMLAAIWLLPAFTFVLAWTNEYHDLIWSNFEHSTQMNNLVIFHHGLFFYVWIAYAYILLLMMTILLIRYFIYASPAFRNQAGMLLVSNLFPWIINVVFVTNLNPIPGLDITPMSFVLTGLALTWGLTSYRLFDLVPVAREVLVNQMSDGLLVVDLRCRIIDVNQAMLNFFQLQEPVAGQPVNVVFSAFPRIAKLVNDKSFTHTILEIFSDQQYFFDARRVSLENPPGALIGYLFSFHDISRLKEVETELAQKTTELAQKALYDDLTGLYNRRYFNDTLAEQIKIAERYSDAIFSICFFDLDDFKTINDTLGHEAGDKALVAVARTIEKVIRQSDMAFRMGGDEFLVLYPHTSSKDALIVTERLRVEINALSFNGLNTRISISGGVSAYKKETSVDDVLRVADRRLYLAKKNGKNQISSQK